MNNRYDFRIHPIALLIGSCLGEWIFITVVEVLFYYDVAMPSTRLIRLQQDLPLVPLIGMVLGAVAGWHIAERRWKKKHKEEE